MVTSATSGSFVRDLGHVPQLLEGIEAVRGVSMGLTRGKKGSDTLHTGALKDFLTVRRLR